MNSLFTAHLLGTTALLSSLAHLVPLPLRIQQPTGIKILTQEPVHG